jgi:hypothetical protein
VHAAHDDELVRSHTKPYPHVAAEPTLEASLLGAVRRYLEAHTHALLIEVHPNTTSMSPALAAKLLRLVSRRPLALPSPSLRSHSFHFIFAPPLLRS